jgi:metal-responsive CopG/Arc/MetJ family transcriptional regulator
MKKKYTRIKITATIDKELNDVLDEYIEDNKIYNRSNLIETFIKNQIEEDKKKKLE